MINEINTWQAELGLLPVPLFSENDNAYVMLNGSRGNFCFDAEQIPLDNETRNRAWSSDVSHYIRVSDRYVEVQRWDDRSSLERYSVESVKRNLYKFHTYLEQDSPLRSISIVSHTLQVFRSLRGTLGEGFSGGESLKALLLLLATSVDGLNINEVNLEKWRLSSHSADIANSISKQNWSILQERLTSGRQIDSLSPDIDLVLRHAAGQVFQEAHYEAFFHSPAQLPFKGFLPHAPRLSTGDNTVHYTPSSISRSVVEHTIQPYHLDKDTLTIFDPACGSGEFLKESMRQLEMLGYKGLVKIIGWDISQIACDIANFVLAREEQTVQYEVNISIVNCDAMSISDRWVRDVDLLFMNPPFAAMQNMTESQKQSVRSVLGELTKGRINYSYGFLLLASQSLADDGTLGSVIPASFLDSTSGEKLRAEISNRLTPLLIAKLGSQALFASATVDTAIYVASSQTVDVPLALWADHRYESSAKSLRALRKLKNYDKVTSLPVLQEGFSIYENDELGKAESVWSPKPYAAWSLLRRLSVDPTLKRVNDLFNVRQGVRTGNNSVFLIDKMTLESYPVNEQSFFRPAVVNRSIKNGQLNDSVYIFFPHFNDSLDSERDLIESVPTFYEKRLAPSKQELQNRAIAGGSKWWNLTRPRTIHKEQTPKIISTYYGGSGSFAYDESGNYVVVQGYAWMRKSKKGKFQIDARNLDRAYVAILNSELFMTLLSATSNHIGGGQWDLSTQYVKKLIVPDLAHPNYPPQLIENLLTLAKNEQWNDFLSKANFVVSSAYGL